MSVSSSSSASSRSESQDSSSSSGSPSAARNGPRSSHGRCAARFCWQWLARLLVFEFIVGGSANASATHHGCARVVRAASESYAVGKQLRLLLSTPIIESRAMQANFA